MNQLGGDFINNIERIAEDIYLDGYWQDERYFKDIRKELLRDLMLKPEYLKPNKQILELIQNSVSVSMHVRRADYVTNPRLVKVNSVCDKAYYERAFNFLQNKLGGIKIFVFSDDIIWAEKNLKFDVGTYYIRDNDASRNYLDLYLMSQCKHNIIANSSFSWWGAWLNQNPDKIVIAPRQWSKISTPRSEHIVPTSWIKI